MSHQLILHCIAEALPRFTYRFANEVALHDGIAMVLTNAGVEFEREVVAGPKDRFDFLVKPGIVIEAKVQGSMPKALQQIDRYAARDDVTAIVLVTTRFWGATTPVPTMRGKPLRVVQLRGASF